MEQTNMKIKILIDDQEVKLSADEIQKVLEVQAILENAKKSEITHKLSAVRRRKQPKVEREKWYQVSSEEIFNDSCIQLPNAGNCDYLLDSDLIYKSADTGVISLTDNHEQVIQRKIIIKFFLNNKNTPVSRKDLIAHVIKVDSSQLKGSLSSQLSFMRKLAILSMNNNEIFLSSKFLTQ